MEKLIKTALTHALGKLEVVDRAEFDAQCDALSKACERVKELEKEILDLRSQIESIHSASE